MKFEELTGQLFGTEVKASSFGVFWIYDMAIISVVFSSNHLATVRVILLPFNIEKIGLPAQQPSA